MKFSAHKNRFILPFYLKDPVDGFFGHFWPNIGFDGPFHSMSITKMNGNMVPLWCHVIEVLKCFQSPIKVFWTKNNHLLHKIFGPIFALNVHLGWLVSANCLRHAGCPYDRASMYLFCSFEYDKGKIDSIAASLFVWNWWSWQIGTDDKIQTTILILRRRALSKEKLTRACHVCAINRLT